MKRNHNRAKDERGTTSAYDSPIKTERNGDGLLTNSSAWDLGKDLFGRHSSGKGDLSSGRKRYLKEILDAKHGRR